MEEQNGGEEVVGGGGGRWWWGGVHCGTKTKIGTVSEATLIVEMSRGPGGRHKIFRASGVWTFAASQATAPKHRQHAANCAKQSGNGTDSLRNRQTVSAWLLKVSSAGTKKKKKKAAKKKSETRLFKTKWIVIWF